MNIEGTCEPHSPLDYPLYLDIHLLLCDLLSESRGTAFLLSSQKHDVSWPETLYYMLLGSLRIMTWLLVVYGRLWFVPHSQSCLLPAS